MCKNFFGVHFILYEKFLYDIRHDAIIIITLVKFEKIRKCMNKKTARYLAQVGIYRNHKNIGTVNYPLY